ncbi:Rad52/Rad22 family DNA repair protein [Desulfovibrio gilichinskyi]|uniref:Rad52/22 family double-strand break repair protein n=1 Tax=Desulfovibrio gilichinskyi TaxID=1519643 RepID=A0A1X7C384_9BACT|nr:Rad52/Rad22 family DNA repair protein [Desulfovibrio gilichinskyi]SME89223.1 Rad52/22 family double-strand break repair protein [Desulfovibrio gilichinskyi]
MMDLSKLKTPFAAADIEWRVQSVGKAGNGNPWAKVLAYVTNRAIMDRLDSVCGPENWRNEYHTAPDGGILCGISIKVGDEWVTKWDGAENTQVEAVKGGLSGAMKRAGVQWGIGRYLYGLSEDFAKISADGKNYQGANSKKGTPAFRWTPPDLPGWALPEGDKSNSNKSASESKQQSNPVDKIKKEFDAKEQGSEQLANAEQVKGVNIICTNLFKIKDRAEKLHRLNGWLKTMFPKHAVIESSKQLTEQAALTFIRAFGEN